jgi:hypothetical protein
MAGGINLECPQPRSTPIDANQGGQGGIHELAAVKATGVAKWLSQSQSNRRIHRG